MRRALLSLAAAPALAACSTLTGPELPEEPPPLARMEEPLALHEVPDDEAERVELPAGSFTGIYVTEARRTLAELEHAAPGVRVQKVVENSPGALAGIEEGDLLLEARTGAGARPLEWPSQWREVELETAPGTAVHVLYDRAGAEREAVVEPVRRLAPPARDGVERFREEQRTGVVLRTATEVEARRAGLGPGGGAVVVGLSAGSPWRAAGLRFEDLVVSVDGRPTAHPQVVLDAVRDAPDDAVLALEVDRAGERLRVEAPVSQRAQELRTFDLPPLVSYESGRGETELSLLLGVLEHRTTAAAWEWRLLWLFGISGGDADRLVEVGE